MKRYQRRIQPLSVMAAVAIAVILGVGILIAYRWPAQHPPQSALFQRVTSSGTTPADATLPTPGDEHFFDDMMLSRQLTTASTTQETTRATPSPLVETTAPRAMAPISEPRTRYAALVVHLRAEASSASRSLGLLYAGQEVLVLGESDAWSQVRTQDGQEGFVATRYLMTNRAPASKSERPTEGSETKPTIITFTPYTATMIATDAVYVRIAPRIDDQRAPLTTLQKGQTVSVVARSRDWYRVTLPDARTGYIASAYLALAATSATPSRPNPTPPAPSPAPKPHVSFEPVDWTMYGLKDEINVRAEPSTTGTIVSRCDRGDAVHVTGVSANWCRIKRTNGETAYIWRALLSATRPAPTPAPTVPETPNPPSSLAFVTPSSGSYQDQAKAAQANFNAIKPYINRQGAKNYTSFQVSGNGSTLTVDGLTLPIAKTVTLGTTAYDGLACSIAAGDDPPYNRPTMSGLPAQRGLLAMKRLDLGGYPMGTVLFVEGYGLGVIADRGSLSSTVQLDLCYDAGESAALKYGIQNRKVYIIKTP